MGRRSLLLPGLLDKLSALRTVTRCPIRPCRSLVHELFPAEEEDDEVVADIFGEGEGALDPMALLAGAHWGCLVGDCITQPCAWLRVAAGTPPALSGWCCEPGAATASRMRQAARCLPQASLRAGCAL